MLSALLALRAAAEASVEVRVTAPSGEPACLTRAALVLARWGSVDVVELPAGGDRVRIPLDAGWEAAQPALDFAAILLEAEGLAGVQSDPFEWIGQSGAAPRFLPRLDQDPHAIAFPGARTATPVEGELLTMELRLRAKRPRLLRLTDESGTPLAGAAVTVSRYLSDSNHCGRVAGEELASATSDEDGVVEIPDGDIVYAITVEKPHHVLTEPRMDEYPTERLGRLEGTWTELVLHRMEPRDLTLRFRRQGRPAAGVEVGACASGCPGGICASCCGPLGITDTEGRLHIEGLHPEELDKIFVRVEGDLVWAELGETAWEIDPTTIHERDVDVELPRDERQ